MRKVLILGLAVLLAGCGTPGAAILAGTVANPVTPKIAFELRATMQEIAVAAGTYAKLPRCTHAAPPCSSQAVVAQLRLYVNAGEDATGKLDSWALGHSTLDPQSLYAAALAAVGAAENYRLAQGVK